MGLKRYTLDRRWFVHEICDKILGKHNSIDLFHFPDYYPFPFFHMQVHWKIVHKESENVSLLSPSINLQQSYQLQLCKENTNMTCE